MDAGVCVAGNV